MSGADQGGALLPAPTRPTAKTGQVAPLTAPQKAAVVIAALGPESAAEILQGMSEANIRKFAAAISNLRRIPKPVLDHAITEFLSALGGDEEVRGGTSEARKILRGVLDDDSVARIMEDVEGPSGRTLWEKLSNCSDEAVASFLQNEHQQTAAVVLSKLRSDKAASILERFPPDFARAVVLRLAHVPRLDIAVVEVVKDVIQRDFLNALQREQATRKPADVIGSLLNNVSERTRGPLIRSLEDAEPTLAKQVHRVMFTFGDLSQRVAPTDVALILRAVEEPVLVQALKAAKASNPRIVEFMLSNISKRLAQRLEEEIDAIAEPRGREGEKAQAEVIKSVQALAARGELTLLDPGGDDDEEEEEL